MGRDFLWWAAMKNLTKPIPLRVKARKHLNADALNAVVYKSFEKVADVRKGQVDISLADALMSGYAMFSLKDPSLLAFDKRRQENPNFKSLYGIKTVPCDTRMREICDEVVADHLRPTYKRLFEVIQRNKVLEQYKFIEGCYLLNLDGTGSYSSRKIHSEACLVKKSDSGKVTYHQQTLGAAIVHPDLKGVIPLCPEMIIRQDGQTKNDCERNAAKRFFKKLRQDHPQLALIVNEDALSPNAPHIRDLHSYGLHYILAVKQGDHEYLFECLDRARERGQTSEYEIQDRDDPGKRHVFHFINGLALNKSNPDLLVNVLEYGEITENGIRYWSWVTDFTLSRANVYIIMRGGRARWKIENETFNTLKNQGYHFGHNYGLGKKHLSAVFVNLMMLAFLVDQIQQVSCPLFQAAWRKMGTKRALWEKMRSQFECFELKSMMSVYEAVIYGIRRHRADIINDTS